MTTYKKIVLKEPTRWDTIAYQYLGNCFNTQLLIKANPSIAIGALIPAGTTVLIPVIESSDIIDEDLPIWK